MLIEPIKLASKLVASYFYPKNISKMQAIYPEKAVFNGHNEHNSTPYIAGEWVEDTGGE